jgi:hypothetical protein
VGGFVKQRLVRKLSYWVDRDLPFPCVSLTVAVRVGESDLFDVEDGKGSFRFPLWQAWRREFVTDGLGNREPSRLMHKARESAFAVRIVAVALCFLIASLASDRHTKDQGSLAAFDAAA